MTMSMGRAHRTGTVVMTFPSNCCMDIFPDNKASDYRIQLPCPVTFLGQWEAGLTSFTYARTWFNVPKDADYSFEIYQEPRAGEQPETHSIELPPGHYLSAGELIEVLNTTESKPFVEFRYTPRDQRINLTSRTKNALEIRLSPGLAFKLGWPHELTTIQLRGVNDKIIAPGVLNLDDISNIYINCDVISDSHYVGDQLVPLLKTVSPSGSQGDFVQYEPLVVDWLPLRCQTLQSIHVLITDSIGRKIPFEKGRCCVKIHIRRTRPF